MRNTGWAVLLVVSFGTTSFASAQINPNLETGLKPYGSYDAFNLDTVNLVNRNLIVSIPLVSNPQRGALTGNTVAVYNNKAWKVKETCQNGSCRSKWLPVIGAQTASGMNLRLDSGFLWTTAPLDVHNLYIYSVTDFRGSSHLMGRGNPDPLHSGYTLFYALDGSGYMFSTTRLGTQTQTHDPAYTYRSNGAGIINSQSYLEDTNGNRMTGDGSSALTDTMGRSLLSTATTDISGCRGQRTPTGAVIHQLPGPLVNGIQTTAQLKECTASVPVNTNFGAPETSAENVDENGLQIADYHGTGSLVQSYILYDGSSWSTSPQWIFEYADNGDGSNYGDLTAITLPTGGRLSYTWETFQPWCQTTEPSHTPLSRAVVRRSADANDGNGPQTWDYKAAATYQNNPFHGAPLVGVSDPQGNEVVHTFWQQGTSGCYPYEVYTQSYTGMQNGGTLLKSVRTDYGWTATTIGDYSGQGVIAGILPAGITTYLPNNKVSKIERDYIDTDGVTGTVQVHDPWLGHYYGIPAGNLIEQREYDYGNGAPGPLLRRTHYTYLAWPSSGNHYFDRNILGRVTTETVYDSHGTQVAKTTYGYDEYGLQASGVSSAYLDTSIGPYRGNPTSATRWISTSLGSTRATTSYYDSGVPYVITDPGAHTTTYTYDLEYQGAYPTQTAMPDTHSPSLAHHVVSGQYDFNTGLLTSFTDQNGKTSAYLYDYLVRMTGAAFPDNGAASLAYPDFATVERQGKLDSRWTDEYVRFDGFGRQSRKATFNGQSPPFDQADICYSGDGTVKFKSYAYQGTGFAAAAVCSGAGDKYTYDGLQRVVSVTHSDGSQISYGYTNGSGLNTAAVMTTEEGNGTNRVSRVSQSDGLGRLISVCEVTGATLVGIGGTPGACGQDIAQTGFLTSYGYDTQGNLVSVNQGGALARSFVYDGLSRLTSATNPESGAATYTYTPDGLLATRLRPLPNQTSPTNLETTTYSYDELHRKRSVQYSDGVTPTSTFNYDEGSVAGQSTVNPIGHLTSETTPNTGSYFWNFDSMGRPQGMSQCTPRTCGSNYYNTSYNYDFLGDLTNALLPAGGVFLSYAYNGGARLASVISSLNDANHPSPLLSAINYGPFGVVSEQLGNLMTEQKTYSARGWVSTSADLPVANQILISPATPGSGTITLGGSERSTQQQTQQATPSHGTVTISGTEHWFHPNDCPPPYTCRVYDYGTVWIQFPGLGYYFSVTFGQGSTALSITAALVTQMQNNQGLRSYVNVSNQGGGTIALTSVRTGSGTNYQLTAGYTWDQGDFTNPSFVTVPTGMSGGQDAQYQTVYDTGTASLAINGYPKVVSYNQGSTPATLASALAVAFNNDGSSPVTATVSGPTITVTARTTGANTNYPVSASSSTNNQLFTGSSFTIAAPGTLTGGADAVYWNDGTPVYEFTIPSFAPDGNILQSTDTVNGNWTYTYEEFNQLHSAVASSAGKGCAFGYDRFGNRWFQQAYQGTCLAPHFTFSSGNNRIDTGSYDATGNLLTDPNTGQAYRYDGENRLISAISTNSYSYVYNAEGRRVAKKLSGTLTNEYLFDLRGSPLIELDGTGNVLHTNIFANGSLIATYKNDGMTYFHFSDWLGNRRYQLNALGDVNHPVTCTNYPFGDGLSCTGTPDATEHHFTAKEHDVESGLDYFGARYYGSGMGRYVTTDWAQRPRPIPYANQTDPQSLNLYAYVRNSPLSRADSEGHCDFCWSLAGKVADWVASHPDVAKALDRVGATMGGSFKAGGGFKYESSSTKVEISVMSYIKESAGGVGNSGIEGKVGVRLGSVGVEGSVNLPTVKDGQPVNPLTNMSKDGSATLTGDFKGAGLSGASGSDDVSVGATLEKGGVMAEVDVNAKLDALKDLSSTVFNAVATDFINMYDRLESTANGFGEFSGTASMPNAEAPE